MKCAHCSASIGGTTTVCYHCGAWNKYRDIGNIALAVPVIWFFGTWTIIIVIGIAIAVVMAMLNIDNFLVFITIIVTIWILYTVLWMYRLFMAFGPYYIYKCEVCEERSPVSIFPCGSCKGLTVKRSVGNYSFGLCWVWLWSTFVIYIMFANLASTSGFVPIIMGIGITALFGVQVSRYFDACDRTQLQINKGMVPVKIMTRSTTRFDAYLNDEPDW